MHNPLWYVVPKGQRLEEHMTSRNICHSEGGAFSLALVRGESEHDVYMVMCLTRQPKSNGWPDAATPPDSGPLRDVHDVMASKVGE